MLLAIVVDVKINLFHCHCHCHFFTSQIMVRYKVILATYRIGLENHKYLSHE